MAGPRLVFLYGPPAVGKLTVAKAVAERAPFTVLHNHVTIDPVAEVLPFGTKTFWRVVDGLRRDLVAAAAEENIDLIYTFVFAPGEEQHVNDVVAPYEERGGAVLFVQLLASREVLLQRVLEEDRRDHGKITDPGTWSHSSTSTTTSPRPLVGTASPSTSARTRPPKPPTR